MRTITDPETWPLLPEGAKPEEMALANMATLSLDDAAPTEKDQVFPDPVTDPRPPAAATIPVKEEPAKVVVPSAKVKEDTPQTQRISEEEWKQASCTEFRRLRCCFLNFPLQQGNFSNPSA